MANASDFGTTVGLAFGQHMQEKWDKEKHEEFMEGAYAEFQQELMNTQQMDPEDPNSASNAIQGIKHSVNKLMDAAGRFPNNPLISKIAQDAYTRTMDGLKMEFEMQGQAATTAKDRATAKETTALQESRKGLLGGQTEEAYAHGRYYDAQARAEADKASSGNDPDSVPYMSGAPGTVTNLGMLYANIKANADRPPNEASRKAWDKAIAFTASQMAQSKLNQLIGTSGGPEGQPWAQNEASLNAIISTMIDPVRVKNAAILEKMREEGPLIHNIPSDIINENFEFLENPMLASPFKVIDAPIADEDLMGQVLGGDALTYFRQGKDLGTGPLKVNKAIKNLPDDFNALGHGPLQSAFQFMITSKGLLHDDKGNTYQISTRKELKEYLSNHGEAQINGVFGGPDVNDKDLSIGGLKARHRARALFSAMVDKYEKQVARQLGIGVKAMAKPGRNYIFSEETAAGTVERKLGGMLGIFSGENE